MDTDAYKLLQNYLQKLNSEQRVNVCPVSRFRRLIDAWNASIDKQQCEISVNGAEWISVRPERLKLPKFLTETERLTQIEIHAAEQMEKMPNGLEYELF